jgi:MFS family permease
MRVGIGFMVHHAGILFVMLAMASGMFVIGCFGPLIAIYVRDSLHATTRIFGIASAMIGIGMFVGVNALTTLGKRIKNTVLVYSGLAGIAVGLCFLTLFIHIGSTIAATLIIGFSVAGIVVPATTMMQQETPPALMGRVGSTFMSLVFTAQISGLILSGLVADRIGVRHVFGLCAILLAVLIVAGRLWMEPRHEPTPA